MPYIGTSLGPLSGDGAETFVLGTNRRNMPPATATLVGTRLSRNEYRSKQNQMVGRGGLEPETSGVPGVHRIMDIQGACLLASTG
jgi:hypothetical protein